MCIYYYTYVTVTKTKQKKQMKNENEKNSLPNILLLYTLLYVAQTHTKKRVFFVLFFFNLKIRIT